MISLFHLLYDTKLPVEIGQVRLNENGVHIRVVVESIDSSMTRKRYKIDYIYANDGTPYSSNTLSETYIASEYSMVITNK